MTAERPTSSGDGTAVSDEVAMPRVKRLCQRCKVTAEEVARGYVVVSPRGTAHHGAADGVTDCGKDTAGVNYRMWWWPL